jgi:hypothetical protein
MSEKIRCQIMLEADNYRWLIEEQVGRHQKNLSVTINELLGNYQRMVKAVDVARAKAERAEIARREADSLTANYREQVIQK